MFFSYFHVSLRGTIRQVAESDAAIPTEIEIASLTLAMTSYSIVNAPVYIPILQLYANLPAFCGVNSITSLPVTGNTLDIFKLGMVKALLHPLVLLVTSVNRTGTPAFSVAADAAYPRLLTSIVTS